MVFQCGDLASILITLHTKVVNKAVVNVKEEVKRMADLEFEIEDIQKQLEGVPSELLEKEAQIGSLTEQLRFHEHLIAVCIAF